MRALFAAGLIVLSLAPRARADGAFPDSNQLSAPAGSQRLILSTTFGLLLSDDGGATWFWVCEEAIGPNVMQYQQGAAPDRVMYAVDADEKVSVSKDGGRSWSKRENGLLSSGFVSDIFPDPSNAKRAVAVYVPLTTSGDLPTPQLIETTDAGDSFHVLYTAPPQTRLESVEIAASDPKTVYAIFTKKDGNGWIPTLVRTTDGEHFDERPLDQAIGRVIARIASVDRDDPSTLYLRALNVQPGKDGLAVLRERGNVAGVPLVIDGPMSTFLERADGTLLVTSANIAAAFQSTDGITFTPWDAGGAHLRALAERDGALYGAGDNFKDGFAVAKSTDGGQSWQKLLTWVEMCGVYPSKQLDDTCGGVPWTSVSDAFAVEGSPACPKPDAGTTPPGPTTGCGCGFAPVGLVLPVVLLLRRRAKKS